MAAFVSGEAGGRVIAPAMLVRAHRAQERAEQAEAAPRLGRGRYTTPAQHAGGHAPAGSGLRHPGRAGAARAPGRERDEALHARAEPRRARRAEPGRRAAGRPSAPRA
jgi:hypothetical protein